MADIQDNQKLSSERVVMAMLRLGKCLLNLSFLCDLGPSRLIKPLDVTKIKGEINELEEQIESALCNPKHRLLRSAMGIKRNEVPNSLVVRILACVSWQTLNGDPASISISRLAGAVSMGDPSVHLETRRLLRTMVFNGDSICQRDSEDFGGEIIASVKLLKAISGPNQLPVVWTSQSLKEAKAEWERLKNVEVFKKCTPPTTPPPSILDMDVIPSPGKNESPKAIYETLRQTVIGMDDVVRKFSVQMAMHLKRVAITASGMRPTTPPVVVLLIGPSGAGKTFLAEEFGKMSGLPFAVGDMTSVTASAYVGTSVDELFFGFAKKGVTLADTQKGIMLLDEMDKKHTNQRGGDFDASGIGVQYEVLKMAEGTWPATITFRHQRQLHFDMESIS